MKDVRSVVIVGGGHAGVQVASSLRDRHFAGKITIVNDEAGLPYQRPPLSKAYLLGKMDEQLLHFRPKSWFVEKSIALVHGVVQSVHRQACTIVVGGGSIGYDHLVLATGTRARRLPIEDTGLDGVLTLRTKDDANQLRAKVVQHRRITVIGGGFIGLELASVARQVGAAVTVIELAPRLLSRVVTPPISDFFLDLHRRHGVDVRLDTGVTAVHGRLGQVCEIESADGRRTSTDLVVVGVGVVPNSELAEQAGLAVSDGIVVDEDLLTSDRQISAIGDCARYPSFHTGGSVRLESVQNAADHARCVAARITGSQEIHRSVPWFWSDQFDSKLQIAGLAVADQELVVRQAPGSRGFSVFGFDHGRLTSVESIDQPTDHAAARRFLNAGGGALSPSQTANLTIDLRTLSKSVA